MECSVALDTARLGNYAARSRRERLAILLHSTAEALVAGSERARICLGTIVSGRTEKTFRSTVGSFVNLLPVPIEVSSGLQRADRQGEVIRSVIECLQHSQMPFDELVRELPPPDRAHPWFEVLVSLNDWSGFAYGPDPVPSDRGIVPQPIVLSAPRTSWGLMLELTGETDQNWVLRGRWRADGTDCRHIVEEVARSLLGG
jgi:hypothetical protein